MDRIMHLGSPLIDEIIPVCLSANLTYVSELEEYIPHARLFIETTSPKTIAGITDFCKQQSWEDIWSQFDKGPYTTEHDLTKFIITFFNFLHAISMVSRGEKPPPKYQGMKRQVLPPLEVYEYHSFNGPTGRSPNGPLPRSYYDD